MRKVLEHHKHPKITLVDSITEVQTDDAGAIVVTGSHAGLSVVNYTLAHPIRAVFFNDAGVGKDDAGIAALAILQEKGVPAGTVSHTSARIGDANDTYTNGVLSHLNTAALSLGFSVGEKLNDAIVRLHNA